MSIEGLPRLVGGIGLALVTTLGAAASAAAQSPAPRTAAAVTYSKDIAPILQRSCVTCHNPDGGAPMSLTSFEEVRPYARAIKTRTHMGPRAGVMPPWFVEKTIGIQRYKGDPSLTEEELAKVAAWASSTGLRPCAAARPMRLTSAEPTIAASAPHPP